MEDILGCRIQKLNALWLEQIVDNVETGIITTDNKGFVTFCNPYAINILKMKKQITGQNINSLFAEYPLLEVVAAGNQLPKEVLRYDNQLFIIHRRKLFSDKLLIGMLYNFTVQEPLDKYPKNIGSGNTMELPFCFSGDETCDPQGNMPLRQLQLMKECNIIAKSEKMLSILNLCYKIAQFNTPVFILGESGVGKESVARFIHRASRRYHKGKFVAVNCGAFSKDLIISELFGYENGAFTGAKKEGKPGLFEMADKGTFFLDEIAEMPLDLQVKFLRVLQEQQYMRLGGTKNIKVNVRVLAATNRNMEQMVDRGEFRKDLFYRLNVININIPALRERKEDIYELVNHFLKIYNTKYHIAKLFSEDTLDLIQNYDWPGNVRELANFVERLVLTTSEHVILPRHLPENFCTNREKRTLPEDDIPPLQQAIEGVEKELIVRALNMYGSTYKAAKVLGVSQSTVARKAKKYSNEINLLDD